MNEDFNALEWCDATLLAINIDRSNPGVCDEVKVRVRWPDDRQATVCFAEAYGCSALMNFGVLGEEGIEYARVEDDEPGLTHLLDRWKAVGYPLSGLKCFRIETRSTGSVVLIYARTWRMQCPEGHRVPRFLTPDEVSLIHRLLPETTELSERLLKDLARALTPAESDPS